MTKLSLAKDKIRVLLLEGVHDSAVQSLASSGYTNVTRLPKALNEADLVEKVQGIHLLGIRSRTQITERVLDAADRLVALGCFCIGTNQVDLSAARHRGVPVFNAPFSNTRSVAELVMGEIVMLMRGILPKSEAAHRGEWIKSAANSWEVRGKTLGIVGYGNIGAQLGIVAEAFGMRVLYHDHTDKLPLGNARPAKGLKALLVESDVISLHVPETAETAGMIGEVELAAMRRGSFLINASRGTVVDLEAAARALKSGHLLGAAFDVFPVEPAGIEEAFMSPLRGISNVILTPHIGGSTAEAQERIGIEVARKLAEYSDVGSSLGAVNFPQAQLPLRPAGTRYLHIHQNAPGLLARTVEVFSQRGANITGQYLQTQGEIGYSVIDAEGDFDTGEVLDALRGIPGTIRTRLLFEKR
jgi:D-3-phosphoglycerate dehydrogenase / 2-oxoglutarate reductase